MKTAKAEALECLESLPGDATWDNIAYRIYVNASIARGEADYKAGRVKPHDQVMKEMDEWLESIGPTKRKKISA